MRRKALDVNPEEGGGDIVLRANVD